MSDGPGIRLERLLENLMLAGVACSAVCMVVGIVMFMWVGDAAAATSIITAGLFVLMATPGLRVGIAVVEAVRSRDWFFVLVTAAVILLLALSAALAFVSN